MTGDPDRIAALALAEDGPTDITTAVTVPSGLAAEGRIEFRSGGVLAGAAYADAVAVACECRIEWRAPDGRAVAPATVVGLIHGQLTRILRAERPPSVAFLSSRTIRCASGWLARKKRKP